LVIISTRQHIAYMLSALYAIAHLSVRRVDHRKTVEVRNMKLSPAPSLYFLRDMFHPEILRGSPERGLKQGRGG